MQDAVNTEPYAKFFFVRLDMNIAGTSLNRVCEHQIHQFDYRSFIRSLLQLGQLHLLFFSLQFDVAFIQFRHRLHYCFEVFFLFLRATIRFIDARQNGTFRGHDGLDVEASHELDIVHGEDISGVDHRDGQRSAHAA